MTFPVTITGNATADAELRYTQSGLAVCSVSVATSERKFNKDKNEWEDGKTTFVRVSAWRDLAEHVAATVTKGTRITVTGKLGLSEYEKDGVTRQSLDLQAEDVSVSLRYAVASVSRSNSGGGGQQQRPVQQAGASNTGPDTWSATDGYGDESPF